MADLGFEKLTLAALDLMMLKMGSQIPDHVKGKIAKTYYVEVL